MGNANKSARSGKPEKPRPDWPLFPHATRRWAKKVRGKLHYFGPWDDPDGALVEWLRVKDFLLAGRAAPPKDPSDDERVTIDELVQRFLHSKRLRVDSGELSQLTWQQYKRGCSRLLELTGRQTRVEDLNPTVLEELRSKLAHGRGLAALEADVRIIRMLLRFADEMELIDRPLKLSRLTRPPKSRIDQQSRDRKRQNGLRMLEADELRAVLDVARQPMRSMILLALNTGLGNFDVACLPIHAVDLERRWLSYPRVKNGMPREAPLWPETVSSIRQWLALKPEPRSPDDADLMFLNSRREKWVKHSRKTSRSWMDGIGQAFTRLLKLPRCGQCAALQRAKAPDQCCKCGWTPRSDQRWTAIYRPGLSFYAIRHTTETIGSDVRDQAALDQIMGHADQTMAGRYRERIIEDRLRRVTEHVRQWMLKTSNIAGVGP